jgi:DNA-binding IclR family transcriptional regulator
VKKNPTAVDCAWLGRCQAGADFRQSRDIMPDVPYEVSALRKSIAVLEILAGSDAALGVTELARRAAVSKNMAFRICQTLVENGWLEAIDDTPRYRLTLAPLQLFSRPLERSDLSQAVHEPLRRLRDATGQTAYAAVRDGHRAVNVQVFAGSGPLRVAGGLGTAFPLHATAQGKVFLTWDAGAWKELPKRLSAHTPRTILAKGELRRHLEQVRAAGLAWNREEFASGLVGCAAPVFAVEGRCAAAIGVFAALAGHDYQQLAERFTAPVRAAAAASSAALGAPPPGR